MMSASATKGGHKKRKKVTAAEHDPCRPSAWRAK